MTAKSLLAIFQHHHVPIKRMSDTVDSCLSKVGPCIVPKVRVAYPVRLTEHTYLNKFELVSDDSQHVIFAHDQVRHPVDVDFAAAELPEENRIA